MREILEKHQASKNERWNKGNADHSIDLHRSNSEAESYISDLLIFTLITETNNQSKPGPL